MRNPERIQPFLEKLGEIWSSQPDLRFAQVIELIKSLGGLSENVFYVEDDTWNDAFDKALQIIKNPSDFHEIQQ